MGGTLTEKFAFFEGHFWKGSRGLRKNPDTPECSPESALQNAYNRFPFKPLEREISKKQKITIFSLFSNFWEISQNRHISP